MRNALGLAKNRLQPVRAGAVSFALALSGADRRRTAAPCLNDNIGVLLIQRALSTLWDFSARMRRDCDVPQAFQFLDSNLTPDSNHLDRAIGGALVI